MLEEKFTKGEWKLNFELDSDDIGTINISIKAGEQTILSGCGCCGSPFARNVNDLHLIAAAPDMYDMLNSLSDLDECQMFRLQIQELLAKARGESC